ncbi:helix-turn-helix domain-containing protein [Brevifollis gellanilyticus]|uniref:helix-turn-helix transcriptional regulator n=1 Tax=Brevifollis gellanilyticus TaxID=748831 RepID=UPI0014793DD3
MNTTTNKSEPAAFLTTNELCDRWKVSAMFVWRHRRSGKLPVYRFSSRGVRFSMSDVLKLEAEARA